MKETNIITHLKQIHIAIGKKLFEMNEKNEASKHPSPLQMEIIEYLLHHPEQDIFPKDIQEELKVSKAAISDTIEKMERKEFIKKVNCKEDGRKTKVVLLEKGKTIYKELKDNMNILNKEITKNISKQELEEFINILEKMKNNLRKKEEKND